MREDKNLITTDRNNLNIHITNYNRQYWLGQKNYKERDNVPDPYILVQSFADEPNIQEAPPVDHTLFKGYKKSFFLSFKNTDASPPGDNELLHNMAREYFKTYFDIEVKKLLLEITRTEAEWYIDFLDFILDEKGKTHQPSNLKDILNQYKAENKSDDEKLELMQTSLTVLHRHGLVLYYNNDELKDVVWLYPEALVQHVQETILSRSVITSKPAGIVKKQDFESLTDEKTLHMLQLQKVVFLHQPDRNNAVLDEYIIPNYLPLANEKDADYQLFIFGLGKPNFIIKYDNFIPFGFINQMICFYGQQPDTKKFWRNQLLFTLQTSTNEKARVLIQLDFEQLKIKVFFQLSQDSQTDKTSIAEYLFYSMMALYWNIRQDGIFSYDEFIKYKSLPKKTFGSKADPPDIKDKNWQELYSSKQFVPRDAYISIDDKRYISYEELFELPEDQYKIISYGIKEEDSRINKADAKEVPAGLFAFIKKTGVRKNIFISYAHNDMQYRQELQQFLVNLERDGLIEIWQDGLIQAGEDWDKKIKEGLQKADICILLLSQSFIVSNYIHETEFKTIMEKRMSGTTLIIPVLIKECDWRNWKVYPQQVLNEMKKDEKDFKIASFQFLPTDDDKRVKPINKWVHAEDAWMQVTDLIRTFVKN